MGFSVMSVEFVYLGVARVFFFSWFFDDGSFRFRVWLFFVGVCVFFFFFFEGLVGGYGICGRGSVLLSLFGGFF